MFLFVSSTSVVYVIKTIFSITSQFLKFFSVMLKYEFREPEISCSGYRTDLKLWQCAHSCCVHCHWRFFVTDFHPVQRNKSASILLYTQESDVVSYKHLGNNFMFDVSFWGSGESCSDYMISNVFPNIKQW